MRFLLWWFGLVCHMALLMQHGLLSASVFALLWISFSVWLVCGLGLMMAGVIRAVKGGPPKFTPARAPEPTKRGDLP